MHRNGAELEVSILCSTPVFVTLVLKEYLEFNNNIGKSPSLDNSMSTLRTIDPQDKSRSSLEISTNTVKEKSNTEHIIEVDGISTNKPGTEMPENTLEKPLMPHEDKMDSKEQGICSIEQYPR